MKKFLVNEKLKNVTVGYIDDSNKNVSEHNFVILSCFIEFDDIREAYSSVYEEFTDFYILNEKNFKKINDNRIYVNDVKNLKELNKYCELYNNRLLENYLKKKFQDDEITYIKFD